MDRQQFSRSLDAARKVDAVLTCKAVITADHQGFHHSALDWWFFDARTTSPKTCPVCKALDGMMYRGDRIPTLFPYHTHMAVNKIRAKVHPNCRCILHWVGRTEEPETQPHRFYEMTPEEAWERWAPSKEELLKLTPSQFKMIMKFLRTPWK